MASELTVERVLTVVELVPRGRVVSYGDIAGIVGIGPRQVGSFMSRYAGGLPWWRVTNAAGDFPEELRERARPHWADEGILFKRNGFGCRIADYRADLASLRTAYEQRIADTLARMGTPVPHTSNPAARALAAAGISTLEELSEWRRADVAELHGVGPSSLTVWDAALDEADLTWKA
ncbi:alkylated DNA nucleotide flippase Atl1 [Knoellia remsis]|uniref:Alkylated DNA nucleotide flippase Atl1 n=1 Tax=Knoellia remsis TaxID=407159 RepID=A0A2T0UZK3_9MICO|nr:alkylated DNA nucleotide flippase Atl1 [Knoellia remsis]